jgi:hypothetical protein
MRVTLEPAGATFVAPIRPAMPVCEHGTLQFKVLGAARP